MFLLNNIFLFFLHFLSIVERKKTHKFYIYENIYSWSGGGAVSLHLSWTYETFKHKNIFCKCLSIIASIVIMINLQHHLLTITKVNNSKSLKKNFLEKFLEKFCQNKIRGPLKLSGKQNFQVKISQQINFGKIKFGQKILSHILW